jgi:hypothetical protein
MKTLASFVLAASVAIPAGAAAQSPDASGTWNATFTTQNGPQAATLKLQKSGDKMTGTIASAQGQADVEAQVKDKTLTVWFTFPSNGNMIPIEMTGTLDGDSVKGSFAAGGNPVGDWSATRAKDEKDAKDTKDTKDAKDTKDTKDAKDTKEPAKPAASGNANLTGDWNVSLQLDAFTATPSLTLKQDGDKLTGEYVSQMYGKAPVTGTVKGTELTFTVSLTVEGNAINAVYNGVVQADGSLKGSVDIGGGAMAGTFTAVKKK